MRTTATAAADDAEARIRSIRDDPARRGELVALLREDSPIYDGRGAAAAGRLRGWVLAAFEDAGCPPEAERYVLADLQNDLDPYVLAAAARAVRGMADPSPAAAELLVDALERLPSGDEAITFEALHPSWPARSPTTAVTEILRTIEALGDRATGVRHRLEALRETHAPTWSPAVRRALEDAIAAVPEGCCGGHHAATPAAVPTGSPAALDGLALEDQDGARETFDGFFRGRRSVVAFFYTRCDNPAKCSLTVTRLAELQRRLAAAGSGDRVNLAAITYDPGYDLPHRLRAYGSDRGLEFGARARMFRAPDGGDELRRHFDLRVGYTGSIVNRHAVELYVLDADARAEAAWSGLRWDVGDVLGTLHP